MAWDDPASKAARRRWLGEAILWLLLTGLAIAGLQDSLVVVGTLLILPGIVLMLAPNLLLYGPPVRLALGLRRQSRIGAVAVLGVGGAVAFGLPMMANARTETYARRLQAEDFDHIAPSAPAPRTIAFDNDCLEACVTLLGRGLVDRIVTPVTPVTPFEDSDRLKAVFSLADAATCRAAGMAEAAEDCILRKVEMNPRVDAILEIRRLHDQYRDMETREQRLNLMEPGRQWAQRLVLWRCVSSCSPVARRTYVRQERVFAPLVLGTDQNMIGFRMQRAWIRVPWGGEVDPTTFLASKWPAKGKALNAAQIGRLKIFPDAATAPRA